MKKLLLIHLLAFSVICAQAQNKTIDSLQNVLQTKKSDTGIVNTWNHLSYEYINAHVPTKATHAARKAMALSEEIHYVKGKADASHNMGMAQEISRNYDKAHIFYHAAINYYRAINDKNKIAGVYSSIASSYNGQENVSQAVKYVYLSLRLYEQTNNKLGLAINYMMIGGFNLTLKNYDEAIKNLSLAMRFCEELQLKLGLATAASMLGKIYLDQGNYAEAFEKISYATKIYEDHQEKWNLASSLIDLGSVYEKQETKPGVSKANMTTKHKYVEALNNYFSALKIYEEYGSKLFMAVTHISIGRAYTKLNDFSKAAFYLEKALDYLKQNNSKTDLEMVYLGLAELDSAKGNYRQAYHHYKLYSVYHDSVLRQDDAKAVLMNKLQYESEKNEAVAQAERANKEAEQSRIRNLQYVAIVSLGVLAIIVILIANIQWRYNKQKRKANILLQQEKEKVETTLTELKATQAQLIQSEKMASLGELTAGIAHEIQNPLNFVNNFSEVNDELLEELKSERLKEPRNILVEEEIHNDIVENNQKISHHGKRADAIVKSMIEHSRSSRQKELTDLNSLVDEYLTLAFHGMRARDKSFNTQLDTQYDPHVGKVNLVPQDMGRVFINLFNNAFYSVNQKKIELNGSYKPVVAVSTKRSSDKIEIRVRDNGVGIPQKIVDKIYQPFFTTKPTGQGTGLGLSLSYDIITKEHGGELKVDTIEGEYAEFIILLL